MRINLQYITTWIFSFVVCASVFSQKTIITGQVTDAETSETLPFVGIVFKDSKTSTTTDLEGNFKFETYYATDSIIVKYVGYKRKAFAVDIDKEQVINVALESSTMQLNTFVVTGSKKDENPAHKILKRAIRNKKINNKEKLDAYQYEAYNKVEFDLNNVNEKFQNRKIFKKFDFIFDNVDTSGDKPYLPIFITESLSDFFYRKNPKKQKEFIKAARVSGVNNESVSQFLGDMYQNINVYDNQLIIFGKNFISPVNDNALFYYKYYLTDSASKDGYWCYKLEFQPRRKSDLSFKGEMWIHDTTYAIKEIDASISENANINYIKQFSVKQTFSQIQPEVWLMTKDEAVADINLLEKEIGFYGRKTSSYKNFVINKPESDDFFSGSENIVVLDDANERGGSFWNQNRHGKLTEKEQGIYNMIDTLKDLPIVKSYIDIIRTLSYGWKDFGLFEIGPYSSIYSYNPIEGSRLGLGIQTSNKFSKRFFITSHVDYGFLDERWKYKIGSGVLISKKPRRFIKGFFQNDVAPLQNAIHFPNINSTAVGAQFYTPNLLSSFLRRNPNDKLLNVEELNFMYSNEWMEGLSTSITFKHNKFSEISPQILFNKINRVDSTLKNFKAFDNNEIALSLRFALKEKFISGEFDRTSLGTQYPIIQLSYARGIEDMLGADFSYHKFVMNYRHTLHLGYLGTTRYEMEAGKIWGTVAYPVLFIPVGNETYGYNDFSYNAMNIGEFMMDQYVSGSIVHHFEGLFLNNVPLLRKLKWREVISGKIIYGLLDDRHRREMEFPYFSRSLSDKPYMETSVGIENIFKILRIDALWRLSYLDNNFITPTGNKIEILKFGIRAKLQIMF